MSTATNRPLYGDIHTQISTHIITIFMFVRGGHKKMISLMESNLGNKRASNFRWPFGSIDWKYFQNAKYTYANICKMYIYIWYRTNRPCVFRHTEGCWLDVHNIWCIRLALAPQIYVCIYIYIHLPLVFSLIPCIHFYSIYKRNFNHIEINSIHTFHIQLTHHMYLIDGLMQDCSISIANALEMLQSCTKSSIYGLSLS